MNNINFFKKFLTDSIKHSNISVIGDYMLDQYFYGEVSRISPEAPVPVSLVKEVQTKLGGAANVVHNLVALGCKVNAIGVIGNDSHGEILLTLLERLGVDTKGMIRSLRKTTTKTRVLGNRQQIVRIDFEDSVPINQSELLSLEEAFFDKVKESDAVILSDYGKGLATEKFCRKIIETAHAKNIPVLVDPKGSDWEKYKGADYITPNIKELGEAFGTKIANRESEILSAAQKLMKSFDIKNILATRSEKGMTLVSHEGVYSIPTKAREVFDVSGAGDTVISVFTAGIASGLSSKDASVLSNLAAGIGVGKLGTYAVSNKEILEELKLVNDIGEY